MRTFQLTSWRQVAGVPLGLNYVSDGGKVRAAYVPQNPVQQFGGWLGSGWKGQVTPVQIGRAEVATRRLSDYSASVVQAFARLAGGAPSPQSVTLPDPGPVQRILDRFIASRDQ